MFEKLRCCFFQFFKTVKFKKILNVSFQENRFRLFRIIWCCGTVGDGKGYNARLSVALMPRFYSYVKKEPYDIRITILGIAIHYSRSYGGINA